MVATLALLWMEACAQPMMRPQGPLNEFSAIEGTSALQYNLPMERALLFISSLIRSWIMYLL